MGWAWIHDVWIEVRIEPPCDKTNKMICAPSILPVWSVFAVRMKKAWVLSYPVSAQQRHWSDWADAQADLSLRWAHRSFCWFCHEAAQIRNLSIATGPGQLKFAHIYYYYYYYLLFTARHSFWTESIARWAKKWRSPEKKHLTTCKQNLACLICDPS